VSLAPRPKLTTLDERERAEPPPVREARDRFVVDVRPSGISAVVCADGVRRTVVEMVKEAEAKEGESK
jgi:hypothetical protein